jgi:hypothetical protein
LEFAAFNPRIRSHIERRKIDERQFQFQTMIVRNLEKEEIFFEDLFEAELKFNEKTN